MSPTGLSVEIPPSLRLFLHRDRERAVVRCSLPDNASLGHVVQSLGVPLTEVGALLLDGEPAAPGLPAPDGASVRLVPVARPQPTPSLPASFVLDVHLGALARRMRLLGLDTAYPAGAEDGELLDVSLRQRRVLLTRDRGLLRRRALRWGAYVRGEHPDQQLADVLDRFAPALRPWRRCLVCNGLLIGVDAAEVADRLQPGTRRSYHTFVRCDECGRVFWRGAHAGRLEAVVASAVAAAPRN